MKITGWTDWDDNRFLDISQNRDVDEDYIRVLVARELGDRGYRFTGGYHQFGEYGVPIINNKWVARYSQRSWGHLLVLAYPKDIDNSDGYGYCDWAWIKPLGFEEVTPKMEDYKV